MRRWYGTAAQSQLHWSCLSIVLYLKILFSPHHVFVLHTSALHCQSETGLFLQMRHRLQEIHLLAVQYRPVALDGSTSDLGPCRQHQGLAELKIHIVIKTYLYIYKQICREPKAWRIKRKALAFLQSFLLTYHVLLLLVSQAPSTVSTPPAVHPFLGNQNSLDPT